MSKKIKNNISLEKALKQLNHIVDKIEQENHSLEDVIELFKEGSKLAKLCKDKLNKAEKSINSLLEKK